MRRRKSNESMCVYTRASITPSSRTHTVEYILGGAYYVVRGWTGRSNEGETSTTSSSW